MSTCVNLQYLHDPFRQLLPPFFSLTLRTYTFALCHFQFYVLTLVPVIHEYTLPVTTSSLRWYHGVARSDRRRKKRKKIRAWNYIRMHANIMCVFLHVRVILVRGATVPRRRSVLTLSVTNWACKFSNFVAGQWVDQDNDQDNCERGNTEGSSEFYEDFLSSSLFLSSFLRVCPTWCLTLFKISFYCKFQRVLSWNFNLWYVYVYIHICICYTFNYNICTCRAHVVHAHNANLHVA